MTIRCDDRSDHVEASQTSLGIVLSRVAGRRPMFFWFGFGRILRTLPGEAALWEGITNFLKVGARPFLGVWAAPGAP
jgi:hypothetical protein